MEDAAQSVTDGFELVVTRFQLAASVFQVAASARALAIVMGKLEIALEQSSTRVGVLVDARGELEVVGFQ